jgi:hypothetical protein
VPILVYRELILERTKWGKKRKLKQLQRDLEVGNYDRYVDGEYQDLRPEHKPYAMYREAVRKKIVELKEELRRRRNDWQGKPKEEIWSQVVTRTSTTSKEILHYRCKMPFHIFSQRCT